MPVKTHIHKYKKAILGGRRIVKKDGKRYIESCGGYEVFKCALPGCTHFVSRELADGRQSLCWNCGGELILNAENLTLVKPTHRECRKTRGKVA